MLTLLFPQNYVLDDPLSAVDAQVAKELFDNCIRGKLQRENKTVFFVTHQLHVCNSNDCTICTCIHCRLYIVFASLRSSNIYGQRDHLGNRDV